MITLIESDKKWYNLDLSNDKAVNALKKSLRDANITYETSVESSNGKKITHFEVNASVDEARVIDKWLDSISTTMKESYLREEYEEYKDYYIDHNLYGKDEYTVQYEGDDMWFDTEEEAKAFIDSIV